MLTTAASVWAHAAQTDYFIDLFAAKLELQFVATFSTGEPMANATVQVFAPDNAETPWQEATTDAAGQFTFVPDESLVGDWRIDFKQEGHEAIRIVPVTAEGIDYLNISHGGNRDFHVAHAVQEGLAFSPRQVLGQVQWSCNNA
jgi:nickel transport protein